MDTTLDNTRIKYPSLLSDIILHENDLTEQAKNQFSYHDKIWRGFESYRQSILRNQYLTPVGRHLALYEIDKLHTDCKHVLNYAADNIQLLHHNLPSTGPLVICGLPRTGSTFLFNLMACDPNCRAPLYTDMCVDIIPPISRSDSIEQKRRIDAVNLSMKQKEYLIGSQSHIAESHPNFPFEEDYNILLQASFLPFFTSIVCDDEINSDKWLQIEINKDYIYDYHEVFLRLLNSVDMPQSHWLLKSPMHSLHLDRLVQHYPNALLVMTHRNLDEVIPSLCALAQTNVQSTFDKTDFISRNRLTKRCYQFIDKMIEYIMEFRTRSNNVFDQSCKNIFDITYNNLMRDPIAIVRRIYSYFNLH
ncbi:unnamed protein product [Rotaria sp. Silwood2]|nr:unnamed protein product [Rotaria sp. Silwood2]CAF2801387.1 unnamed protein product [Rotaria sp. Silwood2]CAF3034148.1 unnamed protein product [Rotaria sp. Silwood2]CAF3195038.1 unnamed protein product [Rotaria sp. Silwood2]CAF4026560.1 unnamed protein product [Rotaria sp. Silwood2]